MPITKTPIEEYSHYMIYVVSGGSPMLFTAEQVDATKGPTLTSESLAELKKDIDKTLSYAKTIKINISNAPSEDKVINRISVQIKSCAGEFSGLTIVVDKKYDLGSAIEFFEDVPPKKSKRYGKKYINVVKLVYAFAENKKKKVFDAAKEKRKSKKR